MEAIEEGAESLEWPDYVVIAIVLSISATIGLYYRFSGGRQKTSEEYFSANRSMRTPVLAITMTVTYLSGITMLGISGEIYIYGSQFVVVVFGFLLATPIAAFLYLPVFFRLQNMSVYEYLEKRFGRVARLTASVGNLVQMGLYSGVVLFAPALALEATTGLSSTTSIFLIGIICTFYSTIGGIKAVLATDVFQGFLMLASILCVIVIGCYDLEGGVAEVWEVATKGGRLEVLNFDIDPSVRHTWWTLVIGTAFYFAAQIGVNQIQVQRLLSAKSLRSAQLALFINGPTIVLVVLMTAFSGLVLYAWFVKCDPIGSGHVSSFDQVMPYFAKVRLSKVPGLTGFFVAGIFSATLSTVSAMLNSLAAIALADYVKPIYHRIGLELADSRAALVAKILCFVNGLVCMGIAYAASGLGTLIETALGINGTIGGPILGLFSLGMFVPIANEVGSVIGILLSLALSAWISFGQPKPPIARLPISIEHCGNVTILENNHYQPPIDTRNLDDSDYFYLYRISYQLYTPIGTLTTLIFGYVASIAVRCFSKTTSEVDPDLLTPYLAARIRKKDSNGIETPSREDDVLSVAKSRTQL
ncbi:putative sodium-dependent multivitamin transporter [Venturia canescens]|uniref:putative sodium-dependent multivitamin transporter n=1 Tax=Venturia canescens TaxID=32260 RepID=UPI001C9CB188|nr:putative sodium-dependent multivitamin transporter [Venturia canescens]